MVWRRSANASGGSGALLRIFPRASHWRRMNLMAKSVAILLMSAVAAAAQRGAPGPAFEVASVKRFTAQVRPGVRAIVRGDPPPSQLRVSGIRVSITGNLIRLVAASYGLEPFQVSQSQEWTENWATSELYDVIARAPSDALPTLTRVREMMQTLLAERFQLKVSRRNQLMPVYELVVAPGGAKIKPGASADPPLTRGEGSAGLSVRLRCQNVSMADLVELVRREFDRPLIDKTGLAGGFDFSLNYTSQPPGMPAEVAAALDVPNQDPALPVAAALREQLGLRVVPAKEQVGTLVIDYAERPSAN